MSENNGEAIKNDMEVAVEKNIDVSSSAVYFFAPFLGLLYSLYMLFKKNKIKAFQAIVYSMTSFVSIALLYLLDKHFISNYAGYEKVPYMFFFLIFCGVWTLLNKK